MRANRTSFSHTRHVICIRICSLNGIIFEIYKLIAKRSVKIRENHLGDCKFIKHRLISIQNIDVFISFTVSHKKTFIFSPSAIFIYLFTVICKSMVYILVYNFKH